MSIGQIQILLSYRLFSQLAIVYGSSLVGTTSVVIYSDPNKGHLVLATTVSVYRTGSINITII